MLLRISKTIPGENTSLRGLVKKISQLFSEKKPVWYFLRTSGGVFGKTAGSNSEQILEIKEASVKKSSKSIKIFFDNFLEDIFLKISRGFLEYYILRILAGEHVLKKKEKWAPRIIGSIFNGIFDEILEPNFSEVLGEISDSILGRI